MDDQLDQQQASLAEDKICEHCEKPMSEHTNAKRMDSLGITKADIAESVALLMIQYGINPFERDNTAVAVMDAFVSGAEWFRDKVKNSQPVQQENSSPIAVK